MPELPEVETLKQQLTPLIKGKTIQEIVVNDGRLIKGFSPDEFIRKVKGGIIEKVSRRGKVLILFLKNTGQVIIHLRISGWLVFSFKEEEMSRVMFKFTGGGILNICDQRVLGTLTFVSDYRNMNLIRKMGPEPFEIKKKDFITLFAGKKAKVKPLLMDQEFLAGIGNIYAQESLFCAGIHPERKADSLTEEELGELYSCLLRILTSAIKEKGSSVDTFRQLNGEKGDFIPLLKVYQRQGLRCLRCGSCLEKKNIGGRGTCFCSDCQK